MKVFLSYPSEHEEAAREVHKFIVSVEVECWFDKESLLGGSDWDRERRQAQLDADVFLLLCAGQLTDRNGVYQREIKQALKQLEDKRLGSIYILPLRLDDVTLPEELSRLQYIDYFSQNWRQRVAASLSRATEDSGAAVPPKLRVAANHADEGGIVTRKLTDRAEGWEIVVEWPQYELRGDYWDFVNSVILQEAMGGFYEARRHMAEWRDPDPDYGLSDWGRHISEFYRRGDLVSLTIAENSYFAGAVRPNRGVRTINILGETAGIIDAESLFTYSNEMLEYLNEYVNLDLKRQYLAAREDFDVSFYQELSGLNLYRYFNFNDTGIKFNLSECSGLAYVLGYQEVYLPWSDIEQFLAPIPKRILLPDD